MLEEEPRTEGRIAASAERLRREIDRWLDVATSQGERALDAIGFRGDRPWSPRADIIETENTILVSFEVPGVPAEKIDVSLSGNMLTVKGTGSVAPIKEGQTVHLVECRHGEFTRSIPLPVPGDPENVSAEVADGILQLRIGKSPASQPRHIAVTSPRTDLGANV